MFSSKFLPKVINQIAMRTSRTKDKFDPNFFKTTIDLPQKPKKPPTPWLMFMSERKDQVLGQHKMTAPELASTLAREWRTVDKTKYQDDYHVKNEEYSRKLRDYNNSLSDEHRQYLSFQRTLKRETKALKQLRKTNPPRMPRTSVNLFFANRYKQNDIKLELERENTNTVLKQLFQEYKSLTAEEKQKYIDMQEEDRVRFSNEFKQWYARIQKDENISKSARDQADLMQDRLKALQYV